MCLPSTDPTQLGAFHRFQYPSAHLFQSSSVGGVRYNGSKTLMNTKQTSFIIFLTVDSPTRNAKAIDSGESPVARYLQFYILVDITFTLYNTNFCLTITKN